VKVLLVGINAKFIQTNLAIRLLRAYADFHSPAVREGRTLIRIAEWNINNTVGSIVRGIVESEPDAVFFSTYLWNREITFKVIADLRLLLPGLLIGLGGPEVSWSPDRTFVDCPCADLLVIGEGEESFADLISALDSGALPNGIPGILVRKQDKPGSTPAKSRFLPRPPISDLDAIPFPYAPEMMDFDPENRIVYYESSRGCPFSCAYCLSSVDKGVRLYPLDRVLAEVATFLDRGFPLVKFVDRTFNLDPARYLAIWRFIRDRYNGKSLFHFEIAAEYLDEEAFSVLNTMPEGSIQLEIGIQSINPETLLQVGRPAHPGILAEKIGRIPRSIHTHVDLIAGLPADDIQSFSRSFDFAFALKADMLQLGFLKVLEGSPMHTIASQSPEYRWTAVPPYEVLSSPCLSYRDLLVLKDVEQVLEAWYNSGLARNTIEALVAPPSVVRPFDLFLQLAGFVRNYYPDGDLFLPRRPSDSFACLAAFLSGRPELERLRFDFLLQGKPGAFPSWYERHYSKDLHDRALMERGLFDGPGGSRRTMYSLSEYDEFSFPGEGPVRFLFLYQGDLRKKKAQVFRV